MTSPQDLRGRPAVVTGAGSGIGEALARAAAGWGMDVVAVDVDADRLAPLIADLEKVGVRARAAVTDVADHAAITELAADVGRTWGPAGLIVNNAGIEFTGRLWEMDPEQWRKLQAVNVNGSFNVLRAFLPALLDSQQPGHVVMLSSVGGLSIGPRQGAYIVSKYAMRVMAQCLRAELDDANQPVGVTTVLPGPVRTNIFVDAESRGESGSELRNELREMLARDGLTPAEVARLTFDAIAEGRFWVHTHPEMSRASTQSQHAELMSAL